VGRNSRSRNRARKARQKKFHDQVAGLRKDRRNAVQACCAKAGKALVLQNLSDLPDPLSKEDFEKHVSTWHTIAEVAVAGSWFAFVAAGITSMQEDGEWFNGIYPELVKVSLLDGEVSAYLRGYTQEKASIGLSDEGTIIVLWREDDAEA